VSSSHQVYYLIELDEFFCPVNERGCDCIEGAPEKEDGKVVWEV